MIGTLVLVCALSLLARPVHPAPASGTETTGVSTTAAAPSESTASSITSAPSASGNGGATSTSFPPASVTVVGIDISNPNDLEWPIDTDRTDLAPIRGQLGASILGPDNVKVAQQNPDLIIPPSTDSGSVANAKWPFSLSHNRVQTGGWARNQNVNAMPIATEMAGVNMRLIPGAVRELHWHKTAEWAYMLSGHVQVTSVDPAGKNFIGTVGPGDLWFFPAGIPHSLQATGDDPDGAEFVLVFDSGDFSEDSTFLLTDWLAHVPIEVLEKNFQVNATKFKHIPEEELYIFPAPLPGPDSAGVKSPEGEVDNPYTFSASKYNATQLEGGTVKIIDSSIFKVSKTIAMAEVTVVPGGIREMHWHPTQDEWSLFLEGTARITIFASQSTARTFDYQPGDIGYVPATFGHYVENTGNTTLKFLEIFNTDHFEDISLSNWLALTPPELVKAHLGFDDDTISHLKKSKPTVIGPS